MSEHDWQVVSRATPEQVAFYKEHGYLRFGRIFTRKELDALRDHVDRMIASLPPGKRPEELDVPHFEDAWLFRYLAHPRVLDVIECFLGPDIVLWSSHFIAKPGGDGKAVPWHTDGDYWGNRLEPMEVITLWLAVDESTRENGCMRVIPGSHRWQHPGREAYRPVDTTTHVFSTELQNVDESQAVDIELAIGECSFHDAWTVHASAPNYSSKRRCGYTMRYMPAHVVHNDTSGRHRIYLLRGEDRTGGKNVYTPAPEF